MKHQNGGFSFIELMIVLSVLGIMAGLLFPLAEVAMTRQKEAALKQALKDIREALDEYRLVTQSGLFESHTESGYPARLEQLTERHGFSGRVFLRAIPADPFYVGEATSASNTWRFRAFQSPPDNPQSGQDIFDVLSTSDQLGSNGLPYSEW
ncbi:general secretion pathway protein G [Halopseudomonas litoralis]|uniref:General secretion pathway protein G n=1 Tax=Halopseudomonas litoralis TaxID=797277 RepID=A0A1H1QCG9_9GAMM|nr:prepilin-type N-terminal cleavage/methylation domain-containing protein [Halopseudomonas litoralis]SDS21120.1 general secretion pathway protein G [Halopseudomonas litoralis]